MSDSTDPFERLIQPPDLRGECARLQARNKEAVETLRKGFKSGDPTKTAAAIILAIAQLEGHGE